LDGGPEGDGLVGVDAPVGLLAVEEIRHELDDKGNPTGATNKDDFVDVRFVDFGVPKDLLDGLEGTEEEVAAELLETGTGKGSIEINTLEEGIDFNGGMGGGGEGTLGTLASSTETTESAMVGRET
jgi:hypothetical protein